MAANCYNLMREVFLVKIHIAVYCQCTKFRNAAYEKVHLDLLQSPCKIKSKAHSQLSKKFVDKFCSSSFGAIVGSRKNVSNMLCLIMKILTEKNLNIIHFLLRQQHCYIWTITQDLIKLET